MKGLARKTSEVADPGETTTRCAETQRSPYTATSEVCDGLGQDDGPASSRAQHLVYLDAYAIARTEVTRAAFARFVQAASAITMGIR